MFRFNLGIFRLSIFFDLKLFFNLLNRVIILVWSLVYKAFGLTSNWKYRLSETEPFS